MDKKESIIQDLRREWDELRADWINFNLYQSNISKDVVRSLTQELNSTTSLSQLSHNSKEYSKGMKNILEEWLASLRQKSDEIELAYQKQQKLAKIIEQKENSLADLEDEINALQHKETQLNKKREEIYK